MNDNQDHFNVLRKINSKSNSTQRELAEELGFSLGKLNYCLKALKMKGLIKMKNFEKNPNKINYIYVLTPKGIAEKKILRGDSGFIDFSEKKITYITLFSIHGNKMFLLIILLYIFLAFSFNKIS